MRHFRWILAVLALTIFTVSLAVADSVDFSSTIPGTDPQHPYYFGGSSTPFVPFTVTAWVYNNGWVQSTLDGRNDTGAPVSDTDHGVGVCGGGGTTCTGPSDINEIDSIKAQSNGNGMELIQISLTTRTKTNWNSITFSSLDKNGGSVYVTGELFAGDSTPGAALNPSNFATFLCSFNYDYADPSNGKCKSPLDHTNLPQFDALLNFNSPVNATYLYVWAPLVTTTDGSENDFLVRGVNGDVPIPPPSVPEPGSIALLATGLAAASLSIKRKFRG